MREASGHIFGLDVVRASAITLVILSHMFKIIEPLGVIGVELFFVLSGYLVGGIFLRGILSQTSGYGSLLLAFLRRRWARTLPNYFLFMILWIPVFPIDNIGLKILQYSVFCQNLWFPISDFFQVSWSLAVEEWFYIIFPALTTLLLVISQSKFRAILTVIALLIVGCMIARLIPHIDDFNREMRMVVVYRLDALAFGVAGAILAHFSPHFWTKWGKLWLIGAAGTTALSFILAHFANHMNNIGATLLFAGLPIFTAMLIARSISIATPRPIMTKIIGNVSKWSYSMYLCHIPVFFLLYDLPQYESYVWWAKIMVKVLGLALIITISALVYRGFEMPMLDRLSPKKAPH